MNKENEIKSIVNAVFAITDPKIEKSRENQIFEFIKTTVNGDEIKAHLVTDVTINKKDGILIYVLTDKRLIQFEIREDGEIKSGSFKLREIVGGVERSLSGDGTRMVASIKFPPDIAVGLKYNAKNQKVTEFFEKVEQLWSIA